METAEWKLQHNGDIVSADRRIANVQSGGMIDMKTARLLLAAPDMLAALELAYVAILQLHPIGVWRINNQHVYASLRDGIAKAKGQDAQTVQEYYEELSNKKSTTQAQPNSARGE